MTEEQQLLAALAGTDPSLRYSAMISIGKAGLKQHEKRIAGYLNETDDDLRSAAIRVLAFYWRLPTYRDVAASMMRDESEHVRGVAVMSWAAYSLHSRDPDTLRTLYQILVDDNQSRGVRGIAYSCFFTVYQPTSEGLPKSAVQVDKTVEECIDWDRLDAAVRDSGAWRPSGSVLHDVGQINFASARLEMKLTREAFQITRDAHIERGQLDPRSWIRVLGSMDLGGFPTPSASQEGERISLEWTRAEKIERATVYTNPSKYRDIIRVAHELATEHRERSSPSPNRSEVSTIKYGRGDSVGPYGGLRRLLIHSDERFEVEYERGGAILAWQGTLEAGTFDHALALIRGANFPEPGPQRPLVPGEQLPSVALDRGGAWDSVVLYPEDSRYIELVKLSSSILGRVDETLARVPSGMTSPVVDVWRSQRDK